MVQTVSLVSNTVKSGSQSGESTLNKDELERLENKTGSRFLSDSRSCFNVC